MFDRRQFLAVSGAGASDALISGLCPAVEQAVERTLPIIDTHQHLWDFESIKPKWLANADEVLRQKHDSEEYRETTRDLNVTHAIYMEVGMESDHHVAETQRVIKLCESKEFVTVAAVIGGRPGQDGFRPYINLFKDSPYIRGVRQTLFGDAANGYCLKKPFVEDMRFLGELGYSFDICMNPDELNDAVALVKRCPKTLFILDHCGNADPHAFGDLASKTEQRRTHDPQAWRDAISRLAEFRNVVCKISGIVARAPKDKWTFEHLSPIVDHCLDEFHQDRVVFGSDWPVCRKRSELREWVEALLRIVETRPINFRRKLFSENAVRIYKL